MATHLYMVIERFHGGDAVPVYRRFREPVVTSAQAVEALAPRL